MCGTFGQSDPAEWGPCSTHPNLAVTTDNAGSIGGAADWYLKLTDQSGPSAACSADPQYQGNWVAKLDGCGEFCLDTRIFEIPYAPLTVIYPAVTIFSSLGRATFISSVATTTDTGSSPGWHRICAPVRLTEPGETDLPSSADGHWVLDSGSSFNDVIQNVDHILLRVDYTAQPSEIVGYDNICMSAGGCGTDGGGDDDTIPHDPVVTGCLKDSTVEIVCNQDGTYTLTLTETEFAGDDITLVSETPGVSVVAGAQIWSPSTTWTISGATAGQTVSFRANVTKAGGGSVVGTDLCCSGEITIVMPDCPKDSPPIDVTINKEVVSGPVSQDFDISVTNLLGPITFAGGELTVTESIPAGMIVTGFTAPNWTCTPNTLTGPGTISCVYGVAGSLATGATLSDHILVHFSDTGAQASLTNCARIDLAPAVGSETDPGNNEACATVTYASEEIIDLGIEKTGGTSPAPEAPYYAFHLSVSNHGAPFNGNSIITVTDIVPAGMTFDSATGTDWSCNAPPPLVAGDTLICTYIGSGPVAPNTVFSPIDIVATATGAPPFPPFNNCASVALANAGSLVDSYPANDNACVTVEKPQQPATLTIGKTCEPAIGQGGGPLGADCVITVSATGSPLPATISIDESLLGPVNVPGSENKIVSITSSQAWTCPAMPIVAGSSGSCQLPGADLAAAGGTSTLHVHVEFHDRGNASETQNCVAATGLDAQGGTIASSAQICVPFVVPPPLPSPPLPPLVCDPKTTEPDGGSCVCLYDKMTRTSPTACSCPAGSSLVAGKGCKADLSCAKPLIPNSKGTACVCPGTKVFDGKACVAKIECAAPAVPNKAGTECLCPKGTKPTGKGCAVVRAPDVIKIPKLPNVLILPKFPFGNPTEAPKDTPTETPTETPAGKR